MRRSLDVVYLIEHTGRELDVACLVKHYLETRHGLETEVLPVALARRYATVNLDPRLVVVPYAYRATDAYTSGFLCRWKPVPVFNMAWEELLYRAFETEKMPQDVFTRQYVLHHAWGDFYRELLQEAGVPSDHVFVNGQPAYMLYREPYRSFWPSRDAPAAVVTS